MNKKLLSLLLALVMVFSFIPAFAAEEAPAAADKKAEETAKPAEKAEEKAEEVKETEKAVETPEFVKFLKDNGYVEGDKKGDLMLDKNLTRAQFTALLARLDGKDDVAKAMKTLGSKFTDVTEAHWAKGYISFAAGKDWVKGYPDGTFGPEREVTYAEIATVLVRYLGVDTMGFNYPVDYVAKAFELGLMKDLPAIENYKQAATRENMFHMLYNTISQRDFGRFNVYKMIVLENGRTSALKNNEVKAEVLSVVQQANNVEERGIAKVGEQKVFALEDGEKKLADSENLLGKVINATVNENGKLVKVEIDEENYKYLVGKLEVLGDKEVRIAGSKYSVRVDERYYNRQDRRYDNDDRMYRTYLTSSVDKTKWDYARNYSYKEFAKAVAAGKIAPNFVRATVKDGMVMFIDSYQWKDVAPVKEVKRDGSEVYYYNDMRNGSVDRVIIDDLDRVIEFKDGKFYNMDKKDIKADDVIHWMDGLYVVRTDAKNNAKLDKTYIDRNGVEFAVFGENHYVLGAKPIKEPFKSVYAYDNTKFRTTYDRGDVKGMIGKDVKYLLDIKNQIQLITSDVKYNDTVALVNRVDTRDGFELIYPNAPEKELFRLGTSLDSYYYAVKDRFDKDTETIKHYGYWDFTGAKKLVRDFNTYDLVYVRSNEQNVDQMVRMATRKQILDGSKYVSFEPDYARYMLVGGRKYRFGDETDVFVVNYTDKGQAYYVKADLATVIDKNAKNKDLKAYVVNEAAYKDLFEKDVDRFENPVFGENTYGRYLGRPDFARVIVFTGAKVPDAKLDDYDFGILNEVVNSNTAAVVETADGIFETYEIEAKSEILYRNLGNVQPGEVVGFKPVKKSDPKAARFIEVIPTKSAIVERVGYGRYTLRVFDPVTMTYGPAQTFYGTADTKQFRSTNLRYARFFSDNKNEYIDFIEFSDEPFAEAKGLTAAEKAARDFFLARYKGLNRNSQAEVDQLMSYYGTMPVAAKAAVATEYADLKQLYDFFHPEKEARALEAQLKTLVTADASNNVTAVQSGKEAEAKAIAERLAVIGDAGQKTLAQNTINFVNPLLAAAEAEAKRVEKVNAANKEIEAKRVAVEKEINRIQALYDQAKDEYTTFVTNNKLTAITAPVITNVTAKDSYAINASTAEANIETDKQTKLNTINNAKVAAETAYDNFVKLVKTQGFGGFPAR